MNGSLIGKRLGKYEVQTEIGRGGMGLVYRGFDVMLRRAVAIKVEDFADDETLKSLEIESPYELSGLYSGVAMSSPSCSTDRRASRAALSGTEAVQQRWQETLGRSPRLRRAT